MLQKTPQKSTFSHSQRLRLKLFNHGLPKHLFTNIMQNELWFSEQSRIDTNGNPYDTCCKECVFSFGRNHSVQCQNRNNEEFC